MIKIEQLSLLSPFQELSRILSRDLVQAFLVHYKPQQRKSYLAGVVSDLARGLFPDLVVGAHLAIGVWGAATGRVRLVAGLVVGVFCRRSDRAGSF